MAPGATLLFWDAWATGRAARGEAWGFDLLDTALSARDPDGLLVRERAVLAGDGRLDGLGGTRLAPAAGSTGCCGAVPPASTQSAIKRFVSPCTFPFRLLAQTIRLPSFVNIGKPSNSADVVTR